MLSVKTDTIGILSFERTSSIKHLLHELREIHANLNAMNETGFLILDFLQLYKYSKLKSYTGILSLIVKVKVCPIYDPYVGECLLERHLH